jgi:hypothetical protein
MIKANAYGPYSQPSSTQTTPAPIIYAAHNMNAYCAHYELWCVPSEGKLSTTILLVSAFTLEEDSAFEPGHPCR